MRAQQLDLEAMKQALKETRPEIKAKADKECDLQERIAIPEFFNALIQKSGFA